MKYRIPCFWSIGGVMEVEAKSLQEALDLAENAPLPEGNYMEDSFEIDFNFLQDFNPELTNEELNI